MNRLLFVGIAATVLGGCASTTQAQLHERAVEYDAQQAADAFTCKPYAAIDVDFRHCLDLQAQARNLQAQAQAQARAQQQRQASAEALQQASKSLGDAAHRYQCIGHQNEAFCQ